MLRFVDTCPAGDAEQTESDGVGIEGQGRTRMSSRPPPIPEEQRPGHAPKTQEPKGLSAERFKGQVHNPDKRGQTANTKINTAHQGHQQDR
jgi:hypothetical protein